MRNGPFDQLDQLILDPTQRHVEPKAPGMLGYCRAFAQRESINEAARTIDFVCSTRELDRYSEQVDPEAFKEWLDVFRGNPLFMAGHVYVAPDGKPTSIGTWPRIEITADGLEGTAKFMEDDPSGLAENYWQRYRQGVQKAASVGFLTHAWEMRDMDINGARQRTRVFTEVELVEVSAVSIPANRQSLVRAASAFGRSGGAPGSGFDLQTLAEPLRQAGALAGAGGVTRDDLENLFAKYLDTTPGGHMHMLVLDVVEHVLARSGLDVQDEYDIPDDARGSGEAPSPDDDDAGGAGGGDEELQSMLREAAAKL